MKLFNLQKLERNETGALHFFFLAVCSCGVACAGGAHLSVRECTEMRGKTISLPAD